MTHSHGRFCNHVIRAHAASFIAKERNLKFNYGPYFEQMKRLGINLFVNGTKTYNVEQQINDINLMSNIIQPVPDFRNINVNNNYFQTKDFSNYLFKYYQNSDNQQSIIDANKFKERYQNNNDVFVHVRLTDAEQWNQGINYYEKALSLIPFEKGYIASDNIEHPICKILISKYKLIPINLDEVETIMFGSTCKNIVLTGGSFSYIIGLFGFFSNIFYLKAIKIWFPPELFKIDSWHEIV